MTATRAFAAQDAHTPLAETSIERRAAGPEDVAIEILYCGVCHSDLHTARGEWAGIRYPCVPGHEIVGQVTAVGGEVTQGRGGRPGGRGCMVDSCRTCPSCHEGLEQYCEGPHGFEGTYNGWNDGSGENTLGGYSAAIVVDEHFVLNIRHGEDQLAGVAPLLCAGITTWSPLRHWQVGPGQEGRRRRDRRARPYGREAGPCAGRPCRRLHHLGGEEAGGAGPRRGRGVLSKDKGRDGRACAAASTSSSTRSRPRTISTISRALLKRDGTMVLVGVPEQPHPSPSVSTLIMRRKAIAGSLIGGIAETQEMLDFCAEHGIVSDIEMIRMQEIDAAYDRMLKSDVKYRFVIDMASLKG